MAVPRHLARMHRPFGACCGVAVSCISTLTSTRRASWSLAPTRVQIRSPMPPRFAAGRTSPLVQQHESRDLSRYVDLPPIFVRCDLYPVSSRTMLFLWG